MAKSYPSLKRKRANRRFRVWSASHRIFLRTIDEHRAFLRTIVEGLIAKCNLLSYKGVDDLVEEVVEKAAIGLVYSRRVGRLLLRRPSILRMKTSIKGFLRKMAESCVLDEKRREQPFERFQAMASRDIEEERERRFEEIETAALTALLPFNRRAAALRSCQSRLTEKLRRAFDWKIEMLGGASAEKLGRASGYRPQTVKNQAHQAFQTMKACLRNRLGLKEVEWR